MKFKILLFVMFQILISQHTLAQQTQFTQAIYLYSLIDANDPKMQLKNPQALSVDMSGNVYVADTDNNRILKFNPRGELVKSIGGFGWEKEQFYSPYDVSAGFTLEIFIADYNNNRIERYDKDLNYISSLYSDENWEESLQFAYPKSVASSIHGDLFFIDGENNRVIKFNSFGQTEISFGDYDEGKGRLLQPVQICVSRDDQIFVSDKNKNRIVVYDYFGSYLSEIGTNFMKEPAGIFLSSKKLLFVADQGNRRVIVFKPDGDLFFQWNEISKEKGTFKKPVDIVSFGKNVYVLDENQVYVFELN